ncbi:MAG: M48 family metallopeptidase [Firmicutes bacterium]|nr:M48 family metallopeptidase [Bacillota bacterium]
MQSQNRSANVGSYFVTNGEHKTKQDMIISYSLKRSRRKTIAIKVLDGKVQVTAPMRASKDLIEQFVFSKSGWIHEVLEKTHKEKSRFEELIQQHYCLLEGDLIEIDFESGIRTKFKNGVLWIDKKYFGDRQGIFLQIAKAYKKRASVDLINRCKEVAAKFDFACGDIGLTNAKKKWGSCDSKGNIRLNFRLLMLRPLLQEYVIIHELCHILEHNHSAKFWEKVALFCPGYKQLKKELKGYSLLNTIY